MKKNIKKIFIGLLMVILPSTIFAQQDQGFGFSIGYANSELYNICGSVDCVVGMSDNGAPTYALIDFGLKDYDGVSAIIASVGSGYGLRLSRFIEIMPNVALTGDYIQIDGVELEEDEEMDGYMKYFGKAGLKASLVLSRSFQLYASADYYVPVSAGGEMYVYYRELFAPDRNGGLVLSAGVKFGF